MSISVSHSQPPSTGFQPAVPSVELNAEQLRLRVHFSADFRTTEELTPGHDFIGQERARAALDIGLGITSSGFNIFVSGLTGAEKLEALRGWVAQQAAQAPTPGDWVYVHNFAHPDAPRAMALAAGRGCRLKHLMNELVKTLREELPEAFRQEAFDKEKAQLKEKYTTKAQALTAEVEARTRDKGVMIPAANVRNLVLRPDVIEAVEKGQFHLYPIRTIDEGIALLTGVRAGTVDEEGTVNGLVSKRLRDLALGLKAFAPSGEGAEAKKPSDPENDHH